MLEVLRTICICSFLMLVGICDCEATCAARNLTKAQVVNRPCRKTCSPESGKCKGRKVCKCDHECGYSCINPSNFCDRPPSPPHVQAVHVKRNSNGSTTLVMNPTYLYDDFVEYKCQHGYILNQFKPVMCHGRRNWTEGNVSCTPCVANYSMKEPGRNCRKTCQTDKDCKGILKRCLCDDICGMSCFNPNATCESLPHFPNGKISGNYTYGKAVNYVCNEGFKLEGNSTRKCRSDKKWTGFQPYCKGQCTYPVLPTGVSIIETKNRYFENDVIEFSCNGPELVLRGETSSKCQSSGQWSAQVPRCLRSCPTRNIPVGINIQPQLAAYVVGDRVTFTCDQQYFTINGSSTSTCGDGGQWTTAVPVCRQGPCPPTEPVPHAVVEGPSEPTHGQTVTYKCKPGYILDGTRTRTCQENRKMSGTLPSCQAGCTLPKRVGNAYPDSYTNEYRVEEKLKYVCRFGYFMTGSPFVRCQEGGQWTTPRFRCDRKNCKEPPTPDNAYKEGNDFLFGSRVYFYCNKGYEILQRQNFITCGTRGTWRGNLPTCEVVSCLPPVPPAMGSMDDSASDYTYNTHVQYSCQRGYKLEGPARGTCNENATWGEVPVCVVDKDCNFEDFNRPFCGFTNERSLWKRTFSSDVPVGPRGFIAITNFDTHHGLNQKAILSSPPLSQESICIKFYYKLKAIRYADSFHIKNENGMCALKNKNRDDRGRFTVNREKLANRTRHQDRSLEMGKYCKSDHDGRRQLWRPTTLAITNEWLSTDIKFRATPGVPSSVVQFIAIKGSSTSPTNIEIDEIELSANDSCENECQEKPCLNGGQCLNLIGGYRCVCTSRYIGTNCETALTCRVPQPPLHGSVSPTGGTDVFIKEKLRFQCNLDFKLFGSFSSTCIRRRTWSSVVPYCRRKCPYLYISERVSFRGRNLVNTEGDRVNYWCRDRSLVLIGSSTSTCLSSGQWSNNAPVCKRQCNDPSLSFGVRINKTQIDYFEKDVIAFSCNRPDLVIRGASASECQSNGQWSAQVPLCLRSCATRNIPAGITVKSQVSVYAAGDRVTFTCNQQDFYMIGSSTSICDTDGQWTSLVPECRRKCPHQHASERVSAGGRKPVNTEGDQVNYSCKDTTLVLIGSRTSTCQSSGRWSDKAPICKRQCAGPVLPITVSINESRIAYFENDVIVFSCNGSDLVLRGAKLSKCQMNGQWSARVPDCLRSCPTKNISVGISVQPQLAAYAAGDQVTFTCNQQNFTIIGSSNSTCGNDGDWTSKAPECRRKCPYLYISERVSFRGRNLVNTEGDRVNYSCRNRSLVLIGSSTSTCLSSGQWSNNAPVCKRKCPHQNVSETVSVGGRKPVNTEGDQVNYSCKDINLVLIGSRTSTCQSSGRWSDKAPICKRQCTSPVLPITVSINESRNPYFENDVIVFSCNGSDLVLRGAKLSNCQINGQWSARVPDCLRSCPTRKISVDITIQPQLASYAAGDRVTFECNQPNFTIIGSSNSTCGNDGQWTSKAPECRRQCTDPVLPFGVRINNTKNVYLENDVIIFSCNGSDLVLRGETSSKCQSNGQWSTKVPRCLPSCPTRNIRVNITIEPRLAAYVAGDQVTFTCNQPNFTIIGSFNSTCGNDGEWTSIVPECQRQCTDPVLPFGVRINNTKNVYLENDVIVFSCNGSDLVLRGETSSKCQSNGQWSTKVPLCLHQVPAKTSPVARKCPIGYKERSIYCYKVFKRRANQVSASASCAKADATLPVLRNKQMRRFLLYIFNKSRVYDTWIDLRFIDAKQRQALILDMGDAVKTISFEIHEKNFTDAGRSRLCHYLSYRKNASLYRISCEEALPFVCLKFKANLKPVQVIVDQDVRRYTGLYNPAFGMINGGAAVYEQNSSTSSEYLLYSASKQGPWYIRTNPATSENNEYQLSVNLSSRFPQNIKRKWTRNVSGRNGSLVNVSIHTIDVWSEWSLWSECPSSCGYFYRNRNRSCLLNTDSVLCRDKRSENISCSNPCPFVIGISSYNVYSSEKVNFTEAREICRQHNGDLAMIKNNETQTNLLRELRKFPKQSYFIGLTKHDSNIWRWIDDQRVKVDGSNQGGFSHWQKGEPNNKKRAELCGSLYSNEEGRWKNINCKKLRSFICENHRETNRLPSSEPSLCISDPCANGAKCQGNSSFYKCLCNTNTSGERCENDFHCQLPETKNILQTKLGNRSGINVGESVIYLVPGADERKYKYVCNEDGLSDPGCPILHVPAGILRNFPLGNKYQPGENVTFSCGNSSEKIFHAVCVMNEQWNPPLTAERCP